MITPADLKRITIKNSSGGVLTVKGRKFQNNEEYTPNIRELGNWADDENFLGLVSSGTLELINEADNVTFTPAEAGTALQYMINRELLQGNTFVTVTSGAGKIFLATDNDNDDFQALMRRQFPAIVDAGNVTVTSGTDTVTVSGANSLTGGVLDGTIFTIGFTTPGSAGDKWMSNNSEDPLSNEVSAPMPFKSRLVAITYSSKKSGTRGNIEIHNAAFGDTNNHSPIFIWNMSTDRRVATKTDISGVEVNAGDKLGIFIEQAGGTEPDTAVVMLFWQIVDDTAQELTEDYGGYFS